MLSKLSNTLRFRRRERAACLSDFSDPHLVSFIGCVREASQGYPRAAPDARYSLKDLVAGSKRGTDLAVGVTGVRDDFDGRAASQYSETDDPAPDLDPEFLGRRRYVLAELTRFDDVVFVDVAYRCLLKRAPDPQGFAHFSTELRNGRLDRIDILSGLSKSYEGREQAVVVTALPWLTFWRRVRKVPVVGPAITWLRALGRVAHTAAQFQRMEARAAASQRSGASTRRRLMALEGEMRAGLQESRLRDASHADGIRAIAEELRAVLDEHDIHFESHADQLGGLDAELQIGREESRARFETQAQQLREIGNEAAGIRAENRVLEARIRDELTKIAETFAESLRGIGARVDAERHAAESVSASLAARLEHAVAQSRAELGAGLASVSPRIEALDRAIRPLANDFEREHFSEQEAASIEPFYAGLEARFRGDRELILDRLVPYLHWIADSGTGTRARPLLDLGCGRGEWLELLQRNDLHAYGLDSSEAMVAECRRRGVVAEHTDALAYLQNTPTETFGAVSAMHLVEHLPFKVLVLLIREIRRVLKPGGLLIFETPNPENLYVAAYAFRMDPTHRTPLPPPLLEYLVESQGFERTQVLRMNAGAYGDPLATQTPAPADEKRATADLKALRAEVQTVRDVLARNLYNEPDYAVLARRPSTAVAVALHADAGGDS